ncbi:MAG: RhtB family transporter [marine bacterium B5-7]|nr:MAG: RhtB family transporter [marine bacterium B5-7]
MLPEPAQLALFLVSSLALLLLPGPAVFYIIARSVAQGSTAGLVSTLGVGFGSLIHVLAAALGISALLASSVEIFSLLRIAGAGYLIYLGFRALMASRPADEPVQIARKRMKVIFREGVVVNILNPKTAIFFVAFLPQFADPSRGSVGMQIFLLGSLFVLLGITTDGIYALAAGKLGTRLADFGRTLKLRNRIAAGIYFVLGAITLNVEAPKVS